MAAPIALSLFRTRVATAADMTISAAGTFVLQSELDQFINDACKALYDKLVHARGEDYYATSTTYTLIPGTDGYTFPADFYRSLKLIAVSGSDYCPVPRYDLDKLADLLSVSGGASSIHELHYRLAPNGIIFAPTPQIADQVEHFYIPISVDMVNAGDTFDGINGYEEWAVLHAAICCLDKEESDTTALKARLALHDQRIEGLAASRDAGAPAKINDTRRDRVRHTRRSLHNDWNY